MFQNSKYTAFETFFIYQKYTVYLIKNIQSFPSYCCYTFPILRIRVLQIEKE